MSSCVTISSLALIAAIAWTDAKADYAWSFPKDHWAHHGYKVEWWYFTGHLGERFAYQFTLFKVGLAENAKTESSWSTEALVMGHAAITDLTTGEHRFSEVLQRVAPSLGGFGAPPEPRIAWCRAPAGTAGIWELFLRGDGFDFSMRDSRQRFAFALSTRPEKPVVFEGPGGLSRKDAAGSASLYYSQTRLATTGEVELDGVRLPVHGTSWMDKEFGSGLLGKDQVGWDWFSLQLDDRRELMLYVLRRADGSADWASGTLVDVDGAVTYLGAADFEVRSSGTWASAASAARYPARWRVTVPGQAIALDITPLAPAQENVSREAPGVAYWEGAVRIEGSATGRGFVELTGYGATLKPALSSR
jgi:predicted secreted hydrolase